MAFTAIQTERDRAAKVRAGRLGGAAKAALRPAPIPLPVVHVASEASIEAFYRGSFFTRCEWCSCEIAPGRVVCDVCHEKISGMAPVAVQRTPDVSDVRRILAELRA